MGTGVMLAGAAAICFSILNLVQRVAARESKNPRLTTLLFNSWAIVISLVILALTGDLSGTVLPKNASGYLMLGLAIGSYGIFERMRYFVARDLEASVYSTLSNLAVVMAFAGSMFWYQETLTLKKLLGSGIILLSLLWLSLAKGKRVKIKGLAVGILAMCLLGLGWSLDKAGAVNFGAGIYSLLIWALPIGIIIFPGVGREELVKEFKVSGKITGLLALINTVGYFLMLKAMETTDATLVIPITQVATVATVLMGMVFLHEREGMWRKLTAGVLAFIGVVLLTG